MATYKGISGFKVQTLSADPVATAAWSAGGAMNTGRQNGAGLGSSIATWAGGGADDPLGYTANAEEYNGTSWTEVTNLPTPMTDFACAGTQTAGIIFGGYQVGSTRNNTLEYNGASYSSGGTLGTGRKQMAGGGTSTAGLCMCGESPITTAVEEYNGATWSSGGATNTARNNNRAFGIQTSAVTVGGSSPDGPNTWKAETYNGTSWTIGNALNQGREQMANPGAGTTSTAGLIAGGLSPIIPSPGYADNVESWNGTSFSNATAIPSARGGQFASMGSPVGDYLIMGGHPSYSTQSFLYTENSEPNTFLNEGQVWYNSSGGALKFYDGTTVKTVTVS